MQHSSVPLANAWTTEKNACIDWSDCDDILAHGFSFVQLASMHPALLDYCFSNPSESAALREAYDSSDMKSKKSAIQRLQKERLLRMRSERWCSRCGCKGHTRAHCETPADSAPPIVKVEAAGTSSPTSSPVEANLTVLQKHRLHKQRIERLKIVQEKTRKRAGKPQHYKPYNFSKSGNTPRLPPPPPPRGGGDDADDTAFADERKAGVISRIEKEMGIGFVKVHSVGDVKFFLDRVDYGVKILKLGDTVSVRIDHNRDYPVAQDVCPARSVVTPEDVIEFMQVCKTSTNPIDIMAMLLTHPVDWNSVLLWLVYTSERDSNTFVDATHTIVSLTTFIENREPIHLKILIRFLRRTLSMPSRGAFSNTGGATKATAATTSSLAAPAAAVAGASSAPVQGRPFCSLLLTALEKQVSLQVSRGADALMPDQWIEAANYVILVKQYTDGHHPAIEAIQARLGEYFAVEIRKETAHKRQMEKALHGLAMASKARVETLLIPSAHELAVPSSDPASVFCPGNLPINGETTFASVEDFITAQCQLLRADTFESMSRLLPAVCFDVPGHTPTPETLSDVEHAAVFSDVRLMGKVITPAKDYQNPESYIFHVKPSSSRASMQTSLRPGTAVCISTTLDRATVADTELFWGTVTSVDIKLVKANLVVIAPCEGSSPFAVLAQNLRRNEEMGKSDHSILVETAVFMAGYAGIMSALAAFRGPLAMALPLACQIVGEKAAATDRSATHARRTTSSSSTSGSPLISYIPEHCEHAFQELLDDIRSRFTLDSGQEEVMQRLPSSEVLLVQGPPGTGKSFIGCRVVEAYVRYKQLVETGDVLQKINIDLLANVRSEHLLPQVGPVVVITYKNHALDEFLVDLLDSGLWDARRQRVKSSTNKPSPDIFPDGKRLVRIGGQSREERLDVFNLGALMRSRTDKNTIASLRERTYLQKLRLDRLTLEIQLLESGHLPRTYFEAALTAEQKTSMSSEDRDEWLRGGRYVGAKADPVSRTLYTTFLRSRIASALATAAASADEDAELPTREGEDNEDASLSVFQEMKREDERRDYDNTLSATYLSVEAMRCAEELDSLPPPAGVPAGLQSLWSLDPVTRHEYYAYIIKKAIARKVRECLAAMEAIKNVVNARNHAADEVRLSVLQGADVIGLTTTGCAMNQNLIRSLRPSVLVVEEAAEVLESQLLACMTDTLCQVILIGDHFQLKPKVDTFVYEKHNNLNLSFFERLARTHDPVRLVEQRRMHPEIADLVRPFYGGHEGLADYSQLAARPLITASGVGIVGRVPGLAKRVFFWRHEYPEEEAPGSRSKINARELKMVLDAVAHLISQGVMQKSITLITPYLGQCKMLRSQMRISSFSDVHVSTVDLFQGDENDVIILSLVRTAKLTEFIRMRNRLIVACSRARFGMVIVGNDDLLRKCQHWDEVLGLLERNGCVGDALPITYESNPSEVHYMRVDAVLSAAELERGAYFP